MIVYAKNIIKNNGEVKKKIWKKTEIDKKKWGERE